MHFGIQFHSKQAKYRIMFVIWLFLSIIVGYRYIASLSTTTTTKGGTFVEATLQQPNYLPYITANDADKFYQSLLFQGCLYPVFSGTQVNLNEELCHVQTNDYQTFIITPTTGHVWKDSTPFTINDIYFTYKSIIQDNYRNIPHLAGYSALQVTADTKEVRVIFPKASKDNMIFFTNFILPAHILANISLEEYMIRFLQEPIGTTCVTLQKSGKDLDNYIFDLTACPDFALKNYQIKWFKDTDTLHRYIQDNKNVIDFSLDPLPEDIYLPTPILLNSYLTFFFNTKSPDRTISQRQGLASFLNYLYTSTSGGNNSVFVRDPYLFDIPTQPLPDIKKLILPPPPVATGAAGPTPMPNTINRTTTKEQTFILSDEIKGKTTITMSFPSAYQRMSVTSNDNEEYFPVSYNQKTKSLQYNLIPAYKTIAEGKNTYIIKGYTAAKNRETYTLTIRYREQPPAPPPAPPLGDASLLQKPFVVVYFEDEISKQIIQIWKEFLANQDLNDRFVFEGYTDLPSLEGKITTQQYDIVVRTINFGLKKDLSTLLSTDDPLINPSGRKNEALSDLITNFFLSSDNLRTQVALKSQIQNMYRKDPQLMILGKVMGKLRVRNKGGFTYPEKMYVLGRRKSLLQHIQLFEHVSVDRSQAEDPGNFLKFLGDAF